MHITLLSHPLSKLQQEHYAIASGGGSKRSATSKDLSSSQPGPSRVITPTDSDDNEDRAGLGDLVVIVLPGSTAIQPLVELGQVVRISADQAQYRYVPFQNVSGNTYRCQVGHVGRAALQDIVFPVGAEYDEEVKAYRLLVNPLDIHNVKHTDIQ